MPDIVFDSCVLSNFALADVMAVLERLYGRSGFVTDFVAAEIVRGIQKGHSKLTAVKKSLRNGGLRETALKLRDEKDLFEKLSVSLGLGEASSIAVAKIRGWAFASDDRLARQEANSLGVRLTGTVGILIKAKQSKLLTIEKADKALAVMIKSGFYSPVDSIRSI